MDLTELNERQIRILQRIWMLENSALASVDKKVQTGGHSESVCNGFDDGPCNGSLTTELRLGKMLRGGGVTAFQFKRVPSDYYDRTFEERRDILGVSSTDHLCKSIVMVALQSCKESDKAFPNLP
eukprot:Gb_31573 [translate_table: standard]